jgi:hypothetical protein
MPSEAERLATLEERVANIGLTAARTEANTKDLLELARKSEKASDERFDAVERKVEKVETHMNWMKGIFAAGQAAVLAWLGR